MNRTSTLFLKAVIVLIAVVAVTGLIRFPLTEGRAVNLNLINIYSDPFIIYIYLASTPFFVGLYQAFKLLNLIALNKAFSQKAVNTLKNMKLTSVILVAFIALAQVYLRFIGSGEDLAGPTAIGIFAAFAATVVATAAAVFQKLLQNAVDIKSENDLTV